MAQDTQAKYVEFDDIAHCYTLMPDGKPLASVTTIMKSAGIMYFPQTPALERGMKFGNMVHKTCELADLGQLDEASLDPVLGAYLRAWRAFGADTGFRASEVEKTIWDASAGYAGTLDRLGVAPPARPWLIDIKTNHCPPWAGVQLAAYALALGLAYPVERFAVVLKSDGRYRLESFKDRSDFQVWRAALALHNYKRNQKGDVTQP